MDLGEFLTGLAEIGSNSRGWRSPLAVIGALVGICAGIACIYYFDAAIYSVAIGALIGWFIGVVLRGLGFVIVLTAGLLLLFLAYDYIVAFFE